jgi:ATP diphosphatase
LQKKAGKIGFDWSSAGPVLEKVREELAEVEQAMAGGDREKIEEEIGDLLFAVVNLARKLKIEAEVALRAATEKFACRFRAMEALARERSLALPGMTLEQMDVLWDEVKRRTPA